MDNFSNEIDSLTETIHPGGQNLHSVDRVFHDLWQHIRINTTLTLFDSMPCHWTPPSGRFRKQYYILNMLSDILVHTMYTISLVHSLLSNLFIYSIIFQIVCVCENTGIFYTPFYKFSSFPLIRFLSVSFLHIQLNTSISISCAEKNKRLDHSRGINLP